MNGRRARIAAAILCAAAAGAVSCSLFERRPPRILALDPGAAGDALAVAAAFVAPDDKVPGFFKKTLGPSGVLAVQAVVRNNGGSPLLIHSPNGMDVGPGFAGVRLVCGADTLTPLHPASAAAVLVGAGSVKGYRHPSAFVIVASPILPPFGAFTLYKEASVGRFYRPLVNRSLHPALKSGCLGPVRLEPGEERRGWLYFASPPEGREGGCVLLVSAVLPPAAPDTIDGYDFEFSREEDSSGAASPERPDAPARDGDGHLVSLVRRGKRSDLALTGVGALFEDPGAPFERVTEVAAGSATIADVSCLGERVAVALNFTSKSRTIILRRGASPAVEKDRGLPRGIKRAFSAADGTCVVTENGFAHWFNGSSREGGSGTKLTRAFEDAALAGDRLHVFTRDKGVMIFDASRSGRFALVDRRDLGRGERRVAGAADGSFAIIVRGVAMIGDTLAFFDRAAAAEVRRYALAGRVLCASTSRSSVVLQIEDGTVLRIADATEGSARIVEAGWLPFGARALKALEDAFIAVGPDGCLAAGSIGAYRPGSRGLVEASAKVE